MATDSIVHEPNLTRFSLALEGANEPATLSYEVIESDDVTVYDLTHTYVPYEMRGRGVAAKLVKFACSFARENNYRIVPSCSYIPVYLDRNPNDMDVVKKK